jgi:GntR family transcriptional repressor for pyruvate dehydrogenase complex
VKSGLSGVPAGAQRAKADLPEIIADNIRIQIVKGLLTTGSKLPTERELCEYHKVSRVVVREAVARLRHEGLLISQQGKGVFVAPPEDGRFLSITDGSFSKPEDFRKLYEVRMILESGTAALAAKHRDADDILLLTTSLEKMASTSIDVETYTAADMFFHRSVASASKNPFLVLFISFVDSKLKKSIVLALSSLDFNQTVDITANEHNKIIKCIEAGNSEGSRIAMVEHLENSSKRLGI